MPLLAAFHEPTHSRHLPPPSRPFTRLPPLLAAGDVASTAGLQLDQAEAAVKALAADSQATLAVSAQGDIVYAFAPGFEAAIASKSLLLRLEPVAAGERALCVPAGLPHAACAWLMRVCVCMCGGAGAGAVGGMLALSSSCLVWSLPAPVGRPRSAPAPSPATPCHTSLPPAPPPACRVPGGTGVPAARGLWYRPHRLGHARLPGHHGAHVQRQQPRRQPRRRAQRRRRRRRLLRPPRLL